ncbi:unannotated protein [freshwater metagenome]|uniref:Unannotated protein n=1 Tax=freshwater metagenome TaxID=449393 RepID=A0A6J7XSY2_9ZZZZ|nr:hypothetical protein [Actinomycetota bacterium]
MASGLIYIAIAGMWVAYFLPRWVHDRNEFSGKSIERYKSALRVVANGTPGGSSGTGVIHTDLDHEAKVAQSLMQRRIVFFILITSLLTTLIGGAMNSIRIIFSLIPATGIIMYVAHVRRKINSQKIHTRRINQLHRDVAGVSSTNLSEILTTKSQTTKDHWIPLSERELTGVVILPRGTANQRNLWQPNDIPVPTYVNAPKAVVAKRTIDLTHPGQWSDEQERLAREALTAASPSRDEVFDQQLAEEAVKRLDHLRASNQ